MKNGIRTFKCIGCGIDVTKSCTKTVKYCTPDCFHKHGKVGRAKTGEIKQCTQCGIAFYAPKNRSKAITCSAKCANDYQRRNKVSMDCECCGKNYFISKSFTLIGNRRFCSMACRNASEKVKEKLLQMRTEQSKNNPNKFEKMAYSILDKIGIDYIKQHIVAGKFTVDAFIPTKNLVIQFDGDYWHGNPSEHKRLDKRQQKRVALDKSQDAYMAKCGIKVVRFWQSEFDNLDKVMLKIKNTCL